MSKELSPKEKELLRWIGEFGEYEVTKVWCSICEKTVKLYPSVEWIRNSNEKCEKCGVFLTAWIRNKYTPWKESAFLLATIKRDMEIGNE